VKRQHKNKAGLTNMETRTKMIGGQMQIESKTGLGSILKFIIPF
jgi:signal transduction histidine kinase